MGRGHTSWVDKARRKPSWRSGLVVVALIAAASYLAYTKEIPFTGHGYELHAAFRSATTLKPDSPVRIAGVNVGKVTSVDQYPDSTGNAAEVTFTVDDAGRPIHSDATMTIRPRLFLEGNFFIDLHPGSPSAPELASGDTIPITNTARAVQLDEVLAALQSPARQDLKQFFEGFGTAFSHQPSAAEDVTQDPDVQGESAAQAINHSFQYGGRAGKGSAQVSQALLGTRPHDLSGLLAAQSRIFGTLLTREDDLKNLITNFNVTTAALASESTNLSATVRELAPTFEEAQPSLAHLSATLPALRTWASAMTPAVRELPATIRAGRPWLYQATRLLRKSELAGTASQLRQAAPGLAAVAPASRPLFPQLGLLGRCASQVLVPAGSQVLNDQNPSLSTGQPNYRDAFYGLVNLAGAAQPFDGNGSFLRAYAGGGPQMVRADNPGGGFQGESIWGKAIAAPQGTQPVVSGDQAPYRPDFACDRNPVPDLNGPAGASGPPSPAAYP
jgi:ABC-type transporter Mla subunit MlaD